MRSTGSGTTGGGGRLLGHLVEVLVVHLIFRLGTGGLENGPVNLINRTPRGRYRHAIVSLTESTAFSPCGGSCAGCARR